MPTPSSYLRPRVSSKTEPRQKYQSAKLNGCCETEFFYHVVFFYKPGTHTKPPFSQILDRHQCCKAYEHTNLPSTWRTTPGTLPEQNSCTTEISKNDKDLLAFFSLFSFIAIWFLLLYSNVYFGELDSLCQLSFIISFIRVLFSTFFIFSFLSSSFF